ncbi:hypothetical protein AB1K70_10385 [Bremerella sp. JC770]|uniref:hypothetical protein n=1 Tax=Bremerella sp. JC770 TaxID=3232137 RepID=UPI00345AB47B
MAQSQQFEIELVHQEKPLCVGKFLLSPGEDDPRRCILTLECTLGHFQATDWNYFDALCEIREQLEPLGWRPRCYGACEDVYPSNMCRDMGQGMVAYRNEIGRPAAQEHLVETFGTSAEIEPASVVEQRAFFQRWMKSPR